MKFRNGYAELYRPRIRNEIKLDRANNNIALLVENKNYSR